MQNGNAFRLIVLLLPWFNGRRGRVGSWAGGRLGRWAGG
jgi:hypothetical protein